MSWIAAGSAAVGLLGSMGGSGAGGSSAAPTPFAPMNTTFGSVNFKSAGAGDRGKTTGTSDPAAQGVATAAVTPTWLWPVAALIGGILIVWALMPKRKRD
jgi:hypothetical protein